MSTEVRMMYVYSMIFSHITYCSTTWAQASNTILKPLISLYKQTLKVLDRKSRYYCNCRIMTKYNFLNWENLIKYADSCLHGLVHTVLRLFVNTGSTTYKSTWSSVRGDFIIPKGKQFLVIWHFQVELLVCGTQSQQTS